MASRRQCHSYGVCSKTRQPNGANTRETRAIRGDAQHLSSASLPRGSDLSHGLGNTLLTPRHLQNQIRKRLYVTEVDEEDLLTNTEHVEHCIDALRQSLMCSADITPLPWMWVEEDQQAKVFAEVLHQCRDFSLIQKWGMEHHLDKFNPYIHVDDPLQDHHR
jgi:hypothetical protein